MRARIDALRERVRTGFWAIPSLCMLVAIVAGLLLVEVDRRTSTPLGFTFEAGPDGARETLSAISSSMITFTGLVFSITIVVLQLTSSQFSPRVLRTFLRDRQTQWSLGAFVATFVFSVTVLRTVSGVEDARFVPSIATSFAVLLLFVSIGVFVAYIHHVATTIQVSSILSTIGSETVQTVERMPGQDRDGPPGLPRVWPHAAPTAQLPAPRSGVIVRLDHGRLVRLAQEAGVVLRVSRLLGEFVPDGAPLVDVLGDAGTLDAAAVVAAVSMARDRTLQQDVAFGIRQLVDVGERALSPGVNDPTTAVQALDQLHVVLRRLATRPLPDGLHVDDDGTLRLAARTMTLADYTSLALDEIAQYGAEATQVQQRLAALRDDLTSLRLDAATRSVLDATTRAPGR